MSYIGSTPTTQNFIAGTDSFNGNGSATNFTLSRFVNSTNDIQVVVNNVVQYPPNYSVSGNTLTISPAPSSGTNNVYVRYLSTTLQSIAPSQGVAIQFGTGSASLPSISFIGDTNTGIYSPAADTIAFVEGGTEAMRIDSSANVGIGTISPAAKLDVSGTIKSGSGVGFITMEAGNSTNTGYSGFYNAAGTRQGYIGFGDTTNGINLATDSGSSMPLRFVTNGTEQARITTAGLFQFNSGYGSVATAYGCRAWVNFNGTGTVAIRASGNVTSITDNGVGIYTVNFTTAMPDTNFAMVGTSGALSPTSGFSITMGNNTYTTSSAQVYTTNNVAAVADQAVVAVAFFR